jgi:choline dehydrogenase-like flavoprotein
MPEAIDLQDFDTNQAVQRNLRYISEDGVRQDAAHAYVHPHLRDGKHPNLHILVEHEVVRVTSKDAKANGVVLRGTPGIKNSTETYEVAAKKLVVVSAGTLGTPLLLERSGIGHRDKLTEAGIDIVSNVPGVGEDFQDHNTILLSYYTSLEPGETYDDLLNDATTFEKMLEEGHKMLAWNAAEITSKIRPTEEEVDNILRGDARSVWDDIFGNNTNMPVATISTCNG